MDSVSTSSQQEKSSLDYFPSAVPESPVQVTSGSPPELTDFPNRNSSTSEMAVVISIGPSREPLPLMRYEFYNSTPGKGTCISSKEGADYELIVKSKLIQSKFSNLVLGICSLLQGSTTAYLEKLQMWLSFQSCSQAAQALRAFSDCSDVMRAKTIPAVISSLRCYMSWYNYGLVADIAKQFCGIKGEVLVGEYEAELKEYFKRLILHCPPLFPDNSDCTAGTVDSLEVKVGWEASTAVLEDIAIFKHTLCQLCDLDPRFLVIRSISTTNFQMSWAFPSVAREKIRRAIQLNSDTLYHKSKVHTLKMSDFQLDLRQPMTSSASFQSKSISGSLNTTAFHTQAASSSTADDGCDAESRVRNSHACMRKPEEASPIEATKLRDHSRSHEEARANRDKKALSLGTALLSDSNLLSEIAQVSNISFSSIPSSGSTLTRRLKLNSSHSMLHDDIFPASSDSSEPSRDAQPAADISPPTKSVSFLWRTLGRARPDCHANIYIVAIQAISKASQEDVAVRKGQHLKALYRVSDKICVETPSMHQGFVPYSLCRLSRKYYSSQSKIFQLSYLQIYPQSPDGTDTQPMERIQKIEMVVVRNYFPSSHEELCVQSSQTITILYCDSEWIYATNGNSSVGLLPRSVCELSQDSKVIFKKWNQSDSFQSDYIIRRNQDRPAILDENPVLVPILAHKTPSKVGKIYTVIQNFVPSLTVGSAFTIRKGLRVKVVEEGGQLVHVTTKSGASFWIPQNHLRLARKNSAADKLYSARLS